VTGVVVASVVGGLVGGLVGSGVMSVGHALVTSILGNGSAPAAPKDEEEDATVKVAGRLSKAVRGRSLTEREKGMAGHLVHYGFGAAMGLVYGAAAAVAPIVTIGAGAGFGAAVWLGAHAIAVPALGLARSPWRRPPGKEALELVLHLAYGVSVGLVREAVVGISR
jgi:putative membrane protein